MDMTRALSTADQQDCLRWTLDDYYDWDRDREATPYAPSPSPDQPGGLPNGWMLVPTAVAPVILTDATSHLVRRECGGWVVVYRRVKHTDVLGCAPTLARLYNDIREEDYPSIDRPSDSLSQWLGRALVARYDPGDPSQANARVMVALHGWALADISGEVVPRPGLRTPPAAKSEREPVPRPHPRSGPPITQPA